MLKTLRADQSELRRVFALIEDCHAASSVQDFSLYVYPKLKKILPHKQFACGLGGKSNRRIEHIVNVNFPDDYLKRTITPNGQLRSPVVKDWSEITRPVFYERTALTTKKIDSEWLKAFNDYGMHNMVGHGMADIGLRAASYFGFSDFKAWDQRQAYLMELIVPHLHIALTTIFKRNNPKLETSLSPRELDTLYWICRGKSNNEIAQILGISPWTAKIHVKNLMLKLNVFNRGHAAAKALNLGIVDI